jgi:very-short-patch-repair endonuclease
MKTMSIDEYKTLRRNVGRKRLEDRFYAEWCASAARTLWPIREHRMDRARSWRFDFAWPMYRVAVEIQGGQWFKMGHTSGRGLQRDCEKSNAAQLAGWIVLYYTTSDIMKRLGAVVDEVWLALQIRGA